MMAENYTKPESWMELNLCDVIQKISTNKKKVKQKEYIESGSLPVIDQGSQYIGGYTNDMSKKIDCELPVIVFGDHTKIIKYVNFEFAPGADGVKVIRPVSCYDSNLFPFFLKVLVNKIPDKGYARHFQHLEKTKIPLPPLSEQHAIVEKIEELFSELDNGVESLKKAREQLKTYRQAVLKYAFEGKLTQEWREQQIEAGNHPEPAEKLLERIKTEREAHYQKQVEEWKKACEQAKKDGSKKPAKPRKPKELPPLTEKELAELPELPEGWGWVKVGEVSKNIQYGYTASATSKNIGPKLLRITDIQNNRVDWESVPYCAIKNDEIKKYLLEDGDLVFARTGATVGKSYLITKIKCKSIYASYLIRLRFQIYINNYYIYNFFQSIQYWIQITEDQVGIGQPNVNGSKLSELAIPICSEIEQNIIVQEIETRLSVCDQLEQTIEDSLKKAEGLRQSILKKAFEGELTKEWRLAHPELISGENSAESLLARIREEKENQRKNSPQRLKGRKGKSNK